LGGILSFWSFNESQLNKSTHPIKRGKHVGVGKKGFFLLFSFVFPLMLVEGIQGKQEKKGFFTIFFVFPLMLVDGIQGKQEKNQVVVICLWMMNNRH